MNRVNDAWKEKFFKNYYKNLDKMSSCLKYKNNHLDNLFQYTKVKHAEDLICDNLMYLREFDELNDPFDGNLICDFGKSIKVIIDDELKNKDKHENFAKTYYDNKIRSSWEENKKEMNIACFSEKNTIIPMWAHYGDYHKGICVEYDFNGTKSLKNKIFPVYYVKNEENKVLCEEIFNEKTHKSHMLSQLFLRKGKDWSYEKEWRLITHGELNVCYGVCQ